ncbi:FAD-binding oxidoreductase [Kutzneria buriramensis]|uniref:NAD(P)/FAD-dependent oxidoreductase n=1 Tax=Kutzneria buriramensis TaxID=1045776 RepID=UPI001476E266|nr:FAD-dependent oxidoreductase [Kutzneria buriramensis]
MSGGSVTVVGGGVIGLCCAHYLAAAGHRVTVVERDLVGSGASRGNAGEICPDLVEPLSAPGVIASALRTLHRPDAALHIHPGVNPDLVRFLAGFARNATRRRYAAGAAALAQLATDTFELFDSLGVEAIRDGFLFAYGSVESASAARRGFLGLGAPVGEVLRNLPDHEPVLAAGARAGFVVDRQWSIDPNTFVDGLAAQLRTTGVDVIEGARVTRVEEDGERVRVHTSAGSIESDAAVLAAGVWTRELGRGLGADLNLFPGKGYSFSVAVDKMPGRLLHLGDAHVAATPLGDRLRIAGTMEFDRDHDRFHARRIDAIVRAARPYLSGVDWDGRRDEWVGPRPMTPDGLPAIGRFPGRRNVFVATGHNMLGLMLAPATGRLVAELVDGGTAPAAFEPGRMARRY